MGYPGFLFRREDWKRKGGLDEQLAISSDQEFLFWLCLQGPFAFFPSIHYLRREHGANLSRGETRRRLEVQRINLRYLPRIAPTLAQEPDRAERLRLLLGTGFWARELGHYGAALQIHWRTLRHFGWHTPSVKALALLLPHAVRRLVRGRPAEQALPPLTAVKSTLSSLS
jgi:hypothetical protein